MGLMEGKCLETITVKRKTSHGLAGDPVRGTTLTMLARIERTAVRVSSPEGTELVFDGRVFTEPPNAIFEHDLVYFPEDSTADTEAGREIQRVDVVRDLDAVLSHYEGML